MPRSIPPILPRLSRLLTGAGENIKKARLRRKFAAETVAQRAGITRKTLYRVEQGDPAVSLGIYARVLQVLRLEDSLGAIGADDELGRKLQDAELEPRSRAPKRATAKPPHSLSAPPSATKTPDRKRLNTVPHHQPLTPTGVRETVN